MNEIFIGMEHKNYYAQTNNPYEVEWEGEMIRVIYAGIRNAREEVIVSMSFETYVNSMRPFFKRHTIIEDAKLQERIMEIIENQEVKKDC